MTDATQNKMVWPPKQNKHPKGARLPKGKRTHEAVESLWSHVRDTSLPDWARRSALLYLVRSARTHWELMVAARGFRGEPWFTHFTKSGIHAGDHSAWVDQLAAARAVDLGWPLEKWVRVWAVIMLAPAPTSSWRAACEGDYTGLMPRMQALLSAPLPEVPMPPTKWSAGALTPLPWIDHK